ncbi:Hpt domain-containing protein [Cephalotus follicularis]|uniref:Histidine-containing phosphotransfer protein n=1 Tax=Cephalotus follicularis TaxID=3775 RepID=A0A1Q3ATY8_CEPFO|nr:Hpt domain-containing protein [Cephalotus follicularis]
MVAPVLDQRLSSFIQTMHEQGILDHNFDHVKNLQNEESPRFVVEVISMFLGDADVGMADITKYLSEPDVDYTRVINVAHQLKGGSGSLGGLRMANACRELRLATDDRDKQRCLETFDRLKQEYRILRENLTLIAQMETTILCNEARARQG